jgi:hypothetical protein
MAKKTKSTPRASMASKAKAVSKKAPKDKPKTKAGASKAESKPAPKSPVNSAKSPAISAKKPVSKPLGKQSPKPAPKSAPKANLKAVSAVAKDPQPVSVASGSPRAAAEMPAAKAVEPSTLKSSQSKGPKGTSDERQLEKTESEPDDLALADETEDEKPDVPVEKKTKRKDEVKIDRTGDLLQQWKSLFERSKGIKPVSYKMSDNYEAKTPLLHKVLGWGYVLTSQNNRLEVLFEEGIKFLIANYKA